jgi:hypothetical protein
MAIFAAMGLAAILAAYLAGYWPERQRRVALEAEVAALQQRLAEADARVRLGRVLGELLQVIETIEAMNYGQAQALSSRFFDTVAGEADRATDPAVRSVLQAVARQRDPVTSALARGDGGIVGTLRDAEVQLRAALGYPVPAGARP